jgi:UDPglucose 6-dehydrogenase
MRITVVGSGYVGLVTAACFANTGNLVVGYDVDRDKIERLQAGALPIHEPGLPQLFTPNLEAERLHFTADPRTAYTDAEVIFVCVGTPSDASGEPDLRAVFAVGEEIGDTLEETGAGHSPIVVLKSTVPVGTNARVRARLAERTGRPFRMASNPEFLKEGTAIADFQRPDRVVLGTEDDSAAEALSELYEPFVRQGHPILVMDVVSAEMVKYAANAMLATKISFINEIANLCEPYGADVERVRLGMCADRRIGYQFLYPGLGYGGSCFPKDVLACVAMGEASGVETPLLSAVDRVNRAQRERFLSEIDVHFAPERAAQEGPPDLTGRRIAVWGIAFKPGTDDVRDAPAVALIEGLLARGAQVAAYDPVAQSKARALFGDRIVLPKGAAEALDGADALVLCTDWDEFKQPDMPGMRRRMRSPAVFDGRNLYAPQRMKEAGFVYHGIGRPSAGLQGG